MLEIRADRGFDLHLNGSFRRVRRSGEHSRANLFVFCWRVSLMSACLFSHDPPERTATGMLSISSVFPTKRSSPALTFISVFSASIFGRSAKVDASPVLTPETVKFVVECKKKKKKAPAVERHANHQRCVKFERQQRQQPDNTTCNGCACAHFHIEIASIECVSVCHPPL